MTNSSPADQYILELVAERTKLLSLVRDMREALDNAKDFVSAELIVMKRSYEPDPDQFQAEEIEEAEGILEDSIEVLARADEMLKGAKP